MFLDAAPNTMNDLFCPSRASNSILKKSEKFRSFGLDIIIMIMICQYRIIINV